MDEALASALAAAQAEPTSSETWWQLALVYISLNDYRNAITALEKTIEIEYDVDGAWARLGWALEKTEGYESAKDACIEALALNSENELALETLAIINERNDIISEDDDSIHILERLEKYKTLSTSQNVRLGILHYRNDRPFDAITHWRKVNLNSSNLFNLGLAYSHSQVSQDADAVDAWRQAIALSPDYQRPMQQLNKLLPRLLELAKNAKITAKKYLAEKPYEFYLNPFALLNISKCSILNPNELDDKTFMKCRKIMLQELELEDGCLSWLPNLRADKSRAIKISEELLKSDQRLFHWYVLSDPALHRFLTHFDIEHFLASEDSYPSQVLSEVQKNHAFAEWLGALFAPIFDRTLAKAIANRDVITVESMLDGRRWVVPHQEENCFISSRRAVDRILESLEKLNLSVEKHEPTLQQINKLLAEEKVIEILNLLPIHFERNQANAINKVRELCILVFKHHGNAELCQSIINITDRFNFKSISATAGITEEKKQIDEILETERLHEVKLTGGSGARWEIKKNGVRNGETFLIAKEIISFRTGDLMTREGNIAKQDFLMEFIDKKGQKLTFHWASVKNLEEQKKYFEDLMKATLNYILPHIIDRVKKKFVSGASIEVGACKVDSAGVHFEIKGWFTSSHHSIPWKQMLVELINGDLVVRSRSNNKAKIALPIRDTSNAFALMILAKSEDI
jgi:tetratricopeptide (TPR) repeat protein